MSEDTTKPKLTLEGYLTESEVAEALGIKIQTLRTWAAKRKGPPRISVARRIFYKEDRLRAWIDSHEENPEAVREGKPLRPGRGTGGAAKPSEASRRPAWVDAPVTRRSS